MNKLVKVLSIKEPIEQFPNSPSPYSLFELLVDFGDGNPIKVYQNRVSHEAFMLEQKLLQSGVDPELLDSFRRAVAHETEMEIFENDKD